MPIHAPQHAALRKTGSDPEREVNAPRLRVVLDAGPAVHQNAGLARYAERLASALWQDGRDAVDLSLLYNSHSGHRPPPSVASIPARAIRLGQHPWRLGVLASQLLRAPLVERTLPPGGLFHATEHLLPWMARPTIMTVHDLIFERFPQHHTLANRAFLRVAMPLFARRASAIIAVSQHTRSDLIELYGTPSHKVHVVEEGIDEAFRPADGESVRQLMARYKVRRPYLLMVGTLEPRKNHVLAFQALARLKAAGWPHCLVVVGGTGWLFDAVQRQVDARNLTGDVIFAGRVPDSDLPAFYSGAACFLMPSLYEGFGLPVLEAMACAAPVVCSRAGSLPDIAGDAALFVDTLTAEGLADALRLLLSQPEMAARLRRDGLRRAAGFRWQRTAKETIDVYKATAACTP